MKIGPITIILIGVSLFIIGISIGLRSYLPNMESEKNLRATADAYQAEANLLPQAEKRLADAKAMVDTAGKEWLEYAATKTPPNSLGAGGIDISVNPYQLTVDSVKFRNSMQRAVNAQMKKGGVEVVQGPRVPDPPTNAQAIFSAYYNYPAIPFPVVIFNLGEVTVRGTYEQITENVRQWANMPNYLAVADGLQISGTAPKLTGTYSLSLVGYIYADQIYPSILSAPDPEAAQAGGAGRPGAAGAAGGGSGANRPTAAGVSGGGGAGGTAAAQ